MPNYIAEVDPAFTEANAAEIGATVVVSFLNIGVPVVILSSDEVGFEENNQNGEGHENILGVCRDAVNQESQPDFQARLSNYAQ